MNLNNKIALITGGNRGVGKETALRLAEFGADVILTYRSHEDEAAQVVAELEAKGRKATALRLDLAALDSYDSFVAQLRDVLQQKWSRSNLDCLINNAGFGVHETIGALNEASYDALNVTHLKGPIFLTQKLLPVLADGGRIVNISSGLSRVSFPGYAVYAAMKGAMEVMTRYMAKELGGRGIAVNIVAPGALMTDFNKERFDATPQVVDIISSITALGRVGRAEDVGGVIAFLCSAEAGWITGQRIEVSGGMSL